MSVFLSNQRRIYKFTFHLTVHVLFKHPRYQRLNFSNHGNYFTRFIFFLLNALQILPACKMMHCLFIVYVFWLNSFYGTKLISSREKITQSTNDQNIWFGLIVIMFSRYYYQRMVAIHVSINYVVQLMLVKLQNVNSSNKVYIRIKLAPYDLFLIINSPEPKAQLNGSVF